MEVQSQPGQIVLETLSQKNPSQKKPGGLAQGVGPDFIPSITKKKKKKVLVLHSETTSKIIL
jgi:hypothetical protein